MSDWEDYEDVADYEDVDDYDCLSSPNSLPEKIWSPYSVKREDRQEVIEGYGIISA